MSDIFKPAELTEKQQRMQVAVKYLQEYFNSYTKQEGYLDYEDSTLIDDALYGLGVALDPKYKMGTGYTEFKKFLREHLGPSKP